MLPDDDKADRWLRRLGVAEADRVDALAARPRRALSVLANQLDNHRRVHGVGGLHTQDWLTHHFRGAPSWPRCRRRRRCNVPW